MVENSVNQVPKVSKVFGVLSLVFSGLGIIGMVMIIIAAAMPSGRSVLIDSESSARLTVFFLGLCLGMQLAITEFARNVLGYKDASSTEFDPDTGHPVIHIMPDQEGVENLGGTLRLGAYPCKLRVGTKAYSLYNDKIRDGNGIIYERHRHRYEVNNEYRKELEDKGMVLSGTSPDDRIVEMIELKEHPYFLATQAHPEFKSRPDAPHPLFAGLVEAALAFAP